MRIPLATPLLAAVAALLLAGQALAASRYPGWEDFGASGESSELYIKVEPPVGGYLRIRLRYEIIPAHRQQYGSAVELLEVDCPGKRLRRVSATIYEGYELSGRVLQEVGPGEWDASTAGSVNEALVNQACFGTPEGGSRT